MDACRTILGSDYFLVHSLTLQASHLIVFAHLHLSDLISNIQSQDLALGFNNSVGNKGALKISLNIGATTLCFISAHLHSGDKGCKKRNKDWARIEQLFLQNN